MPDSTCYVDAILRPGRAEIGVLFPAQRELEKFLLRQSPIKTTYSWTNDPKQVSLQGQERVSPDVLVRLPSLRRSKWKVRVLQRWVGRVEQVKADRFVAVLDDATNPRNPVEQVEFDLNEVSDSDRPLVEQGAAFYWSIGYCDTPGGQRDRVSALRFVRQPRLSEANVNRIFEQADHLAAFLESD